jgi:hypothetical protein
MFLDRWEKVLQGFILILGEKGHLRSWEVIKGQKLKILTPTKWYVFGNLRPSLKWICWNFWDPRSLEAIGGRWRLLDVNTHFTILGYVECVLVMTYVLYHTCTIYVVLVVHMYKVPHFCGTFSIYPNKLLEESGPLYQFLAPACFLIISCLCSNYTFDLGPTQLKTLVKSHNLYFQF